MENSCSQKSPRSCCSFPWKRFWTALGMLVLFLCGIIVVLRWNPEPLSDDAERALFRTKNLAELRKANEERLGSYGWSDQAHGVLHLPIDHAMELELADLNDPKAKPHAAYAIAPIDLVPVAAGIPISPCCSAKKKVVPATTDRKN